MNLNPDSFLKWVGASSLLIRGVSGTVGGRTVRLGEWLLGALRHVETNPLRLLNVRAQSTNRIL